MQTSLPSASNWQRLELCPGSWRLSLKARELGQVADHSSPEAESGTRIHGWLAGETKMPLSDTERDTAEFLLERATQQRERIFGDEKVERLAEKRLWLKLGGREVASARFDLLYYTQTKGLLINFKTGWTEPDPAELNAQLKVEALLVGINLPTLREITAQIVSGPFGITEHTFTAKELYGHYNDMLATLKRVEAPEPELAPSVEACRFCPAQLVCPRLRELTINFERFKVELLPTEPDKAARVLDQVSMLRGLLESAYEWYKAQAILGKFTPEGYELVPGATRREVTNWERAIPRLEEQLGMEELRRLANYSLPAIEKLVTRKLGLRGTELKNWTALVLAGLIEDKVNAPSLKRLKE